MTLTLYEMGMDYLRQHRIIRDRIRTLKKTLPTLTKKQQYLCNRRILVLDETALELKLTGEYLINYYGGRNEQAYVQS